MLTDRYELPLSTASSAARDAYVEGCAAKLTMYPGAIEGFDRAIAADPGFAVAHAARAQLLLERGDAAAARASMAAAKSLAAGLSAREASHIAFFDLLAAGDAEAALAALPAHLDAWPRDALVLGTTAFTNGLIGSSGRAGQKRALLDLLDRLAPSYGDDWWFTAHHGMALSENGQRDAARPKIDRSLAQNPSNPWAAHARAHLCYEEGKPNAARAFLASWLTTYPRNGLLYSHLSWHLALGDLEAGDAAAAFRLFTEAFSPDVHSDCRKGRRRSRPFPRLTFPRLTSNAAAQRRPEGRRYRCRAGRLRRSARARWLPRACGSRPTAAPTGFRCGNAPRLAPVHPPTLGQRRRHPRATTWRR